MAVRTVISLVVRIGLLVVWVFLHVLALASSQRWWFTFWLVLSGPPYIGAVHWLDRYLNLGGVGSSLRRLRRELKVKLERDGTTLRDRSAAANHTVPITTGFAAILLFNSVRFYHDLRLDRDPGFGSETILIVTAIAFCLACVLNLIQVLILRLFDRHEPNETFKRRLRRMLRFLSGLAWHSLLTPVILLLMLLASPLPALFVNAFYGTCLYAYYFIVVPTIKEGRDHA